MQPEDKSRGTDCEIETNANNKKDKQRQNIDKKKKRNDRRG